MIHYHSYITDPMTISYPTNLMYFSLCTNQRQLVIIYGRTVLWQLFLQLLLIELLTKVVRIAGQLSVCFLAPLQLTI